MMRNLIALFLVVGAVLGWPRPAQADTILDPMNLANFQIDGQPSFLVPATRAGDPLTINDGSNADFAGLLAFDNAAAGAADLFVTFTLAPVMPAFADAGFRVAINDGQRSAVVVAAIIKSQQRGIGLATNGAFSDENTYPVFVPVDWSAQTTLWIRRTAAGDAQIVAINGTLLDPLTATLASIDVRGPTRPGATFEFGAFGVEATATAMIWSFSAAAVPEPVPEPASLLLLGSGLAGLVVFRKRFKA